VTVNLQIILFQFSGLIAFSIPLIYVILPETKGLSLETVQGYFGEVRTTFYFDAVDMTMSATSPHLISPQLTSTNQASPNQDSPNQASPNLTEPHLTLPSLTSPNNLT
jgi:hypothetical protein